MRIRVKNIWYSGLFVSVEFESKKKHVSLNRVANLFS
jgi:hypothetical protein